MVNSSAVAIRGIAKSSAKRKRGTPDRVSCGSENGEILIMDKTKDAIDYGHLTTKINADAHEKNRRCS